MTDINAVIDAYKRLYWSIQTLKATVPGRTRRGLTLKVDRRLSELRALSDHPLAKPEVVHDFLREQGLNWESKKEELCTSK